MPENELETFWVQLKCDGHAACACVPKSLSGIGMVHCWACDAGAIRVLTFGLMRQIKPVSGCSCRNSTHWLAAMQKDSAKSSWYGANKAGGKWPAEEGRVRSVLNYTSEQMSWFSSYHQCCWRYVKHAHGTSIQSWQIWNMPQTRSTSLEELSNIICA